jgi:DNA-binding MarR family transcriptional regulator
MNQAEVRLDPLAMYFALVEVGSLVQQAVQRRLRDDGGLTDVQFRILSVLDDAPGRQMRITDIADRVVYSRSALTYQSRQLVKANLVSRAPSTEDERSTILALTNRGVRLLDRVLPSHVDLVRRSLLSLSEREAATLGELLVRVRDQLRAAPPSRPRSPLHSAEGRDGVEGQGPTRQRWRLGQGGEELGGEPVQD